MRPSWCVFVVVVVVSVVCRPRLWLLLRLLLSSLLLAALDAEEVEDAERFEVEEVGEEVRGTGPGRAGAAGVETPDVAPETWLLGATEDESVRVGSLSEDVIAVRSHSSDRSSSHYG